MLEVVIAAWGLYDGLAPEEAWRLFNLKAGTTVVLAPVALAMAAFLLTEEIRAAKSEERYGPTVDLLKRLASKGSLCAAVHESVFYSMWAQQVSEASHNVDIAHLGATRPNRGQSKSEDVYFEGLKATVKKSTAQFRRLERLTARKVDWIDELMNDFKGVARFSLAVYEDPLADQEMPAALSVSRVDERYAWIVAMARQQSTDGCRDLLVCAPEGVRMLRDYFEERLWKRSTVILNMGQVVNEDVWARLRKKVLGE